MTNQPGPATDFRALFEAIPTPFLVLLPDDRFTIAAASDSYLGATLTTRAGIVGRGIFETFPDNPGDPEATGVRNLRASLRRVLATRAPDRMAVQKYDIPLPGGGFEERHWSPLNAPVLSPDGEVSHILHHVEDVTEVVRMRREGVEQKLVEASLRESGEWFATTLNSVGDAVIAADPSGRVAFMNGVAERLTGWDAADAKGLPLEAVFVIVHGTTRAPVPDPVRKVLTTGEIQGLAHDTVLIAKDGGERPIEDSAAPILNDRGRITGVVLVFHDVTEKRKTERALVESEEFNRRVVASSPDCLKVLDLEGRLLSMNEFGCRLMEIDDLAPFVDREWAEFWPEEARETVRAALATARGGALAAFRGFGPTAKGTGKWWDVSVSPVLGADGRPVQILSVSRDITDRVRAEETLKASEERYRTLFETMDDGFCVVEMLFDPAGRPVDYRFQEMNPAFEQHTGLKGVVGETVRELAPDLDAFWFEAYGRVALTGQPARFVHQAEALGGRWFDVSACRLGGQGSRKVAIIFKDITDRKRTEQERERLLREVESERERLADVFQRAPSFMCVLRSPEHVFERINDRYYQLVGHRDLLGKPARAALPEVEGQGFFELLDGVYRTGEAFVGTDMPVLLQRGPGDKPEERFIDVVYQALRDPDGVVTGILAQGIDLTERKRAEEEVRSKTERLNLLVENTRDYAVVITDPEGTVIEWQGGAERITGFAAGEVVGRKAHLIFTPEDRASGRPEHEMKTAAETGRAVDKRWHVRKGGAAFYADGVMTALYDEDGRLRGFGKVFKDATVEMRTGEATRRRAVQLQKLAEISARINAARDVNSVVRVVTEEARTLIGARQAATSMVPDPGHPQPVNVISTPSNRARQPTPAGVDGVRLIKALHEEHRPIRLSQGELGTDPRWRTFEKVALANPVENGWLAAPLVGRNGRSLGLLQLADKEDGEFSEDDEAILVQLSRLAAIAIENARLYDELRANDERKDEFLAMLAHELRNPLAAIANAVRLASKTDAKEHVDWSMGVITRQMQHLSRLIDDLMDVSRITRGKIELRRDVMDVTPILESAAATVRTLVEERKHTLDLAVDRRGLWANVDPTRLEQVVVNLLNNAAKYSENAGHIRLSARVEGGEVVVGIKDRGVGIRPEKLPEMFEMFAQGDRSLARSEGGLGIGLTVVKKLVEMHGGSITAESEGLGKGSEFTIRLPAASRPSKERPRERGSADGPVKRSRILVVDDNVDTARGMARLLKLIGHDVATAHDGPEAIREAKGFGPDFILLDIGLPGMSGYEVASQLRREECCKDALIVAVSGYGQAEDRRRSKAAGFDFHLTKPLDHDALLTLLSAGVNDRS